MTTTVIKEIVSFLFGRKYYANIIGTHGVDKQEVCSYIFSTKEGAMKHRDGIMTTRTFYFIETISFRSRKEYTTYEDKKDEKNKNINRPNT